MQQHEQAQFLRALGLFVTEQVRLATAPLMEKIAALEARPNVSTEEVKSLIMSRIKEDLELGSLADFDDVISTAGNNCREMILQNNRELLAGLPQILLPSDVTGICDSIVDVRIRAVGDMIPEEIRRIFEENRPKDGEPGKPGKDGEPGKPGKDGEDGTSVSLADVEPVLHRIVGEAVAALPVPVSVVGAVIDRGGDLCIVLSSGETKSLGKVVGQDGKPGEDGAPGTPGKDGVDGIGFKDMSVTFDGERAFIFKFTLEDRVEELSLTVPFMIYRGVWKEGSYSRGDCVTRDGSMFVARDDTDKQPGTIDSGWQLATKRGRDGKDLR